MDDPDAPPRVLLWHRLAGRNVGPSPVASAVAVAIFLLASIARVVALAFPVMMFIFMVLGPGLSTNAMLGVMVAYGAVVLVIPPPSEWGDWVSVLATVFAPLAAAPAVAILVGWMVHGWSAEPAPSIEPEPRARHVPERAPQDAIT